MLIRGLGGRELGGPMRRIETRGEWELWRIGVWFIWGQGRKDAEEKVGRSDHIGLGDMFRKKLDREVGATAGVMFRFSWVDDWGQGRTDWSEKDRKLLLYGWEAVWEEVWEVERMFVEARLVFPWQDIGVLAGFWHRMCLEQRMAFLDILRVLGGWAMEQERVGRAKLKREWARGERQFLFCIFVQTISAERNMEVLLSGMGERRTEVTGLIIDLLGCVFYRNLGFESEEHWERIFKDEEAYRYFRRGGLGQFFNWGDGEWEQRRAAMKRTNVFFSLLGEWGWILPDVFCEAAGEWGVRDRKTWWKTSFRKRRVDSVSTRRFFKLW